MPDDETVNQMIARHEEEFDLFMVSTVARGRVALFYLAHIYGAPSPTYMKQGSRVHTPHPDDLKQQEVSVTVVSLASDGARGGLTVPPN